CQTVCTEYREWLREERGLAVASIDALRWEARHFCAGYIERADIASFSELNIRDVDAYFEARAPELRRKESFDRGRDLAAWLGLVPRQFTTGGKPKLLGISKRGNRYLRRQLIHGARAALPYVAERDTQLGRWAKALMARAHRNVAVVAFANKLARIAWAVLRRGDRFAAPGIPAAG